MKNSLRDSRVSTVSCCKFKVKKETMRLLRFRDTHFISLSISDKWYISKLHIFMYNLLNEIQHVGIKSVSIKKRNKTGSKRPVKLICFRFFNYSKRKDIFLTNQYLNKNTIRKWPLTRSFVTRSSSFIHLFCLITLIPLIYLITLYKFIYGVDLSWTRGFVVPGNLARPRIYPRSSSSIEFVPPLFIQLPFKVQLETLFGHTRRFYINL